VSLRTDLLTVLKVVFDLQIHDRADPTAGVGKRAKEGFVPMINDVSTFPIGSIRRLILGKRPRFHRRCVKTRPS
jgi:hypothetical protein